MVVVAQASVVLVSVVLVVLVTNQLTIPQLHPLSTTSKNIENIAQSITQSLEPAAQNQDTE